MNTLNLILLRVREANKVQDIIRKVFKLKKELETYYRSNTVIWDNRNQIRDAILQSLNNAHTFQ